VIDARGRVIDSLPLGRAGDLDVHLPAALPPTIYAHTGDAPLIVVLLLLSAALVAFRRNFD
jgi:apolipoprotein N-acyltransferase